MLSIGPPRRSRSFGQRRWCAGIVPDFVATGVGNLGTGEAGQGLGRSALLTQDRVLHNLAIGRGFQSFVHTSESGLRAPNEIIFDLQRPFGLQPFITRHV